MRLENAIQVKKPFIEEILPTDSYLVLGLGELRGDGRDVLCSQYDSFFGIEVGRVGLLPSRFRNIL